MNTTTAAPVLISTSRQRDDYGRGVLHTLVNGRTVCVRVTLPKTCADRYLINDWAGGQDENGHTPVHYLSTLAEARAIEAGILGREIEKAQQG